MNNDLLLMQLQSTDRPADWEGEVSYSYTRVSIEGSPFIVVSIESDNLLLMLSTGMSDWIATVNGTNITDQWKILVDGQYYVSRTDDRQIVSLCGAKNGTTGPLKFWVV